MATPIIAAATGAATRVIVSVEEQGLLMATNLGGAEAITIEFTPDGGTTWETLAIGGAAQTLIVLGNVKVITGPITLGVSKGSTSAAVGVWLATKERP